MRFCTTRRTPHRPGSARGGAELHTIASRRRVRARIGLACLASLMLATPGCRRPGSTTGVEYPEATAYDREPDLSGEWYGEIGSITGTFEVGALEPGRFFGGFRSDDGETEFTLLLEQVRANTSAGASIGSNQFRFTWQDGLGGRGRGWLLINREETGLTGQFGFDEHVDGYGKWTFIRVDV